MSWMHVLVTLSLLVSSYAATLSRLCVIKCVQLHTAISEIVASATAGSELCYITCRASRGEAVSLLLVQLPL
jgi:hypothetical protein